MAKYATRVVAIAATHEGYRVRYSAAATKEAAEFERDGATRHRFPAEVIEVTCAEWESILRGAWDTFKPTPGLED